jgi:hypothetical protein
MAIFSLARPSKNTLASCGLHSPQGILRRAKEVCVYHYAITGKMKKREIGAVLLLIAAIFAAPVLAKSHSAAAFQKLQSLAGNWEGKDDKGKTVKTNFKSIVSDTAVLETLSPSGMEDMVTVFSLDGDGIALVHFCPTNNQPRMRVVPATDDVKELAFDFEGAGNLPSPTVGHQHHLVVRFDDPDHITETWTWRQDNMDMPMIFHLTRKKN